MNILFLLKSYDIGGLEVVTTVLANKFHEEGHKVVLWAFFEGQTSLRDRLDKDIPVVYGEGFKASKANISRLQKTLLDHKIDIVINQWGLPFVPAYTLKRAAKGLNVKIIAVYHNAPSANGRLKDVEIAMDRTQYLSKLILLRIKHWVYRQITAAGMRYSYRNSDRFLVLSPSFIEEFQRFTGLKETPKLMVQTNPVTVGTEDFLPNFEAKQAEILFVGRLEYNQKRVERVVEVWSLIEHKHPEWRLTIVGDGPERESLERLVSDLGLRHVAFEGFRRPEVYYKRASILLLTSEYEGFGLVVVEAMSFGVVPVVLGSYSAVFDILQDGKNGMIVPYDPDRGFQADVMADRLEPLMDNVPLRTIMGKEALKSSVKFSLNEIGREWEELFAALTSRGGVIRLFAQKIKEIIYVGRLDYSQKRAYRVLDVWSLLEQRLPDWHLTVVGNGPERRNLERMTAMLELQHVSFEGFRRPRPYYERASLLILVSEFEGFPLVLAEAMSFGVVPVVYGSYSAVYDIIEDGRDGLIVPKTAAGFSASEMAERTVGLMGDDQMRKEMAVNAIEKSRKYSIDKIYAQWMEVMKGL